MMTFLSRCSTTLTMTTLFLLVQLLLSPPPISATTNTPLLDITDTPVLDMDGNPVEPTSQYYIIPDTPGFPSGLRLKLRPQSQYPLACPDFVYRTSLQLDFGLPVIFIPTDPAQKTITLLTDLQISFVSPDLYCPPVWNVTTDPETSRTYVSTGVQVEPNCKVKQDTTLDAFFNIWPVSKTQPYVYVIKYSPLEPPLFLELLALFHEDDTDWLGLSRNNQPKALPVYFKKRD